VNTAGTGTYTQYSLPNFIQTAAGTGTVGISGTTITFSATGTKLSMLAEFTPTYTTLTETQPVPMRTVPFALT
jgi:hypothetical protein